MYAFSPFEFFVQIVGKETKSLQAETGPWAKPQTAYNKAKSMQRKLNEANSYVQVVMRLRNQTSIMDH